MALAKKGNPRMSLKSLLSGALNAPVRALLAVAPLERILDLDNHIRLAYRLILRRRPDPSGFRHYKSHIEAQGLPKAFVFEALATSPECKKAQNPLAYVRCALVQRLPHAEVIVDFGGSTRHMSEGALYAMGYKQKWRRLLVVDLPPEERYVQWRPESGERAVVETPNGPVEHLRGSMASPGILAEQSFADMVWSGNAIEHITAPEADIFLDNVYQALKPGGIFCLDTPNRRVTGLQFDGRFSNADHKIEYTHEQLSAKLREHGFAIEEQLGVLDCKGPLERGHVSGHELTACPDFTAEIADGYFLFYRCRKPAAPARP